MNIYLFIRVMTTSGAHKFTFRMYIGGSFPSGKTLTTHLHLVVLRFRVHGTIDSLPLYLDVLLLN